MESFEGWLRALEARHLSDLRFAEVSRALRALSSLYVERRSRLQEGLALSGAGKRAAFALFYGPLHYLLLREIAAALQVTVSPSRTVVDVGCGTGASAAGFAAGCGVRPSIVGIDCNPWALGEAAWTYETFGFKARLQRGDAAAMAWPGCPAFFLLAFALNELAAPGRDRLKTRLSDRVAAGDGVLIVEPLAGAAAPWWNEWRPFAEAAGGRADEWRFPADLPAIVAKLDRAAGLSHRELTGRSLWIPSRS